MHAVSDASPLIVLSSIGRLGLLRQLFETVVVPPAVFDELKSVILPDWVGVVPIPPGPIPAIKGTGLGRGETEAIQLALRLRPDRLLLDDGLGRREARRLELKVTGVLGLLLAAKQKGILVAVRPEIDALRNFGFRASESLYRELLASCGEV